MITKQIIDELKEDIFKMEREGDYVYNNNTGKLHTTTCGYVKLMNNGNKVCIDGSLIEHVLSIMEVDFCHHCFNNTPAKEPVKHIHVKTDL